MTNDQKKELENELNQVLKGQRLTITTYPKKYSEPVWGNVNITIGNLIRINNAQIRNSMNGAGAYVRLPSYKDKNNDWKSVCIPSKEFSAVLNKAVLSVFSPEHSNSETFNEENNTRVQVVAQAHLLPENSGALKALATLKIPDVMTFTTIKVLEDEERRMWCSPPGFRRTDANGDTVNYLFYTPLDKSGNFFRETVINAYKQAVLDKQIGKTKSEKADVKEESQGKQMEKGNGLHEVYQLISEHKEAGNAVKNERQR